MMRLAEMILEKLGVRKRTPEADIKIEILESQSKEVRRRDRYTEISYLRLRKELELLRDRNHGD